MYQSETVCPVCGSLIPPERQIRQSLFCQCGWSSKQPTIRAELKTNSAVAFSLVATGAVLLAGILHFITWDTYSIEIAALKFKEVTNMASISDYLRIAEVCNIRNRYGCQEEALTQAAQFDQTDIENWALLGILQYKLERIDVARKSLEKYFSLGGKSLDAAFTYAKLEGQTGDIATSKKYFRYVLAAKPDIMQISVAKAYVEMLMRHQKYSDAKKVIEFYRRKGDNTQMILNNEFEEIKRQLSDKQVQKAQEVSKRKTSSI